jgi:hypothetical protein
MVTIQAPGSRSLMTTDSGRFGFETARRGVPAGGALADLTSDVTTAVSDAFWTFMLQGELEDAFDSALLRAAMSETPVLSGRWPVWAI